MNAVVKNNFLNDSANLDTSKGIQEEFVKLLTLAEDIDMSAYGENLNRLEYEEVESEEIYQKLNFAERQLRSIKIALSNRLMSCVRKIEPKGAEDWRTFYRKMDKAIEVLSCLENIIADEQGDAA